MECIGYRRSIIVACDVSDMKNFRKLLEATYEVPGIGAYKIGLDLALGYGLTTVVDAVKDFTRNGVRMPVIYDHQKAGNDIPEMGPKFAARLKSAGVDAVILFPFAGSVTERHWIKSCRNEGLEVLVGGHMTHEGFLTKEGGFIDDCAPFKIYKIAVEGGVRDFVVPGNRPDLVRVYRDHLSGLLGPHNFVLYAPGFINQGGDISETGRVAGENWHAIVGSAIYNAGGISDMKRAARKLVAYL